ncbi:hypothetical protein ST37_03990 [Vibrio sp. qd031]|nr:hypothetical protein ST37_03990 [Vibrio sp. qd031]
MPMLGIASDFKTLILLGGLPVIFIKFRRNEIDKKIVYLLVFSIVIQVISWINSLFVIPDEAKSYPDIKLLTTLFLFAVMALWISGDKKRQHLLYLTLIVSFIATAFYDNAVNGSFATALNGRRIDYGMHNAQYTTMVSAVVIMLSTYLFYSISKVNRKLWHNALFLFVIGFSVFSMIASQSRQIWLAMVVLGVICPIVYSIKYKVRKRKVVSVYALMVVVVLSLISSQNIRDRVMKESDIILKIATLQWDDIPMTSVGIRFNSWIESIEYIERSPLVGASKESIKLVTQQSEKFQASSKARNIGHLHNYYLETLVAFGVVGLIFIVIYYRHIYIRVKNKNSDAEFLLFLVFLIFWLIINNFESFNSKFYGLYIQNIVFAGLFRIYQEDNTSQLGEEYVD